MSVELTDDIIDCCVEAALAGDLVKVGRHDDALDLFHLQADKVQDREYICLSITSDILILDVSIYLSILTKSSLYVAFYFDLINSPEYHRIIINTQTFRKRGRERERGIERDICTYISRHTRTFTVICNIRSKTIKVP